MIVPETHPHPREETEGLPKTETPPIKKMTWEGDTRRDKWTEKCRVFQSSLAKTKEENSMDKQNPNQRKQSSCSCYILSNLGYLLEAGLKGGRESKRHWDEPRFLNYEETDTNHDDSHTASTQMMTDGGQMNSLLWSQNN